MPDYKIETLCVQAGYEPKNGDPRVLPIYASTTFKYDSAEHVGDLFDLKAAGHMYSRISNPTLEAVENKLAALEGGSGALLCSSGQAANTIAILNICKAGQNIVSLPAIYGGTINLFAVSFKKLGVEVRFTKPGMSDEEIESLIDENTRLFFGETIANPALTVMDIERYASLAHKHDIPLFVDNTFATPIFCRPFDFGADVVIHSTTKYMDGHASCVGGVIIDGGKFNWANGKFPELTEVDESYHGVRYVSDFGNENAYITKARVQLMRDYGMIPSPFSAFILNLGLESLHVRMERHSENALKVAKFLEGHEKIASVNYPALESSDDYPLAQKYFPNGCCGVISFIMKGGRDAAVQVMNKLDLAKIVVHVADARTCVLHPASMTHRQLTDEQLVAAGVDPGLVRFSVGIENVDDIIADLKQALED